jgi:hypothetical protein
MEGGAGRTREPSGYVTVLKEIFLCSLSPNPIKGLVGARIKPREHPEQGRALLPAAVQPPGPKKRKA